MTPLPSLDDVRLPPRWLLHRARRPAAALIGRRWEVHLHNADRVPTHGPVIFAPNHAGWMDGPLLAVMSPRPVHVLTKEQMFSGPLGPWLRAAGQIEIDRFHVDVRAVRTCVRVLDAGLTIGIFPEGSRGSGEMETVRRGAAYLALVTGAPVVPVTFFGTRLPGGTSSSVPPRGSRFDAVYGEPVYWERQPWPRTRDDVTRATTLLAGRLREHLAQAKELTGRSLPGPLPHPEPEPLRET